MSRNNRLIDLVFSDIVGTEDRINAGDKFLATDKTLGIAPGLELFQYKGLYQDTLNRIKPDMQILAQLEEKIVQHRCLLMVGEDIKLYIVRKYIYARALFYRKGIEGKDIRVIVGTTDTFGDDLERLFNMKEFMELAEYKVAQAMKEELVANKMPVTKLKLINS